MQELIGQSLADVLHSTPIAGVTKGKTPATRKKENRKRWQGVKHAMESELHERNHDLLLQNRLSMWKYNSIRLVETPEKAAERTRSKSRPSSRIQGTLPEHSPFNNKDANGDYMYMLLKPAMRVQLMTSSLSALIHTVQIEVRSTSQLHVHHSQ